MAGNYGQQTPYDAHNEFNVISFIFQRLLAQVNTVKIVSVKAVNGGGSNATPPTVDVLPLVNQLDGSNHSTPHSTVYGLPVLRLGGSVVVDPLVGDVGVILICDRDISKVKSTNGQQANPGSRRRFHWSDGIYLGTLFSAAPSGFVSINQGVVTVQDKFGNKLTGGADGWQISGNLFAGSGGGDQVGVQTHTHSGVTTGPGISGPPVAGT